MELGRREVQGVDYAYTINGWMKGINSSAGLMKNDMGEDANQNGWELHGMFASDVYGVVLGYYDNDYKPIKEVSTPYKPFELKYAGSDFDNASSNLYNGNIRNATVSLRDKIYYSDTDISMNPIGYAYTYDQLNRYVKMRAYNNYDTATNSWQSGGAALQDYAETVSYDGNGNIQTYIRHGNPTVGTPTGLTAMDSMTYSYNSHNNQLNTVADGVAKSNYTNDIDNEIPNNYLYDKNGNMTFDSSQHLKITWNVRNKVATVKNDSTRLFITFGYDAMGNRVMKKDSNLNTHKCYTLWYIRDAQGNILSVYKERHDSMYWQECDIYGSSRVGVYYPDSLIYPKGHQVKADSIYTMELWEGKRQYELTNHLGNVLTTVSDKKIMLSSNAQNNSGTRNAYANISSYQPEVVSISDYYPFGMEEPGRNFSLKDDTAFKYGFNGKYKDNDIEGNGNWEDYGEREYLTRLGKFISSDPVANKFPELSTYQFAGNTPIAAIDLDGKERYYTADGTLLGKFGTNTEIRVVYDSYVGATQSVLSNQNAPGASISNDIIYNSGSAGVFYNPDDAANDWGERYNSVSIEKNREMISNIIVTKIDDKPVVTYTEPDMGGAAGSRTGFTPSSNEALIGSVHSHAAYDPQYYNDVFSKGNPDADIDNYKRLGIIGYVATPNGSLQTYNPATQQTSVLSNNLPSDANDPTHNDRAGDSAPLPKTDVGNQNTDAGSIGTVNPNSGVGIANPKIDPGSDTQ